MSTTRTLRPILAVAFAAVMSAGIASAQTTLTLGTPGTQVTDATIGSGTAASTINNGAALAVRLSTDVNAQRRALLKFDTENTIPAKTAIRSAMLTVFVSKAAGATSRSIGVYEVKQSFQESQATWKIRKTGYTWTTQGGSLGTKLATITVPATVGAAITVDVTAQVQKAVNATSRYTRLALVDTGAADSTTLREFHSSESGDTAKRPKLVVVYGTEAAPPPPPAPTSVSTLKVLHWNIHRGYGTDGKYDLERIATWIAKFNPQLVSMNEVERFSSYTTEDEAEVIRRKLETKTGKTWYSYYRTGPGTVNGHGNAVLSRFPIITTSYCQLSGTRSAARVAVNVNGRLINFYSTHLDSTDNVNRYRIAEINQLLPCMGNEAEQKIVAGDFNARVATTEISLMTAGFIDTWAKADAAKTAFSYPGNTSWGATRNARIDYVFLSKTATALVVKRAEVFDTRDANGVMPSDHKPLVVDIEVK